MFDAIRNIISSPFLALFVTLVLWWVIYFLCVTFKLSKKKLKKLEYIWLSVGLLGLLSIVNKNEKEYRFVDNIGIEQTINFDLQRNNFLLKGHQTCFKQTQSDTSPKDFQDRQSDQNLICEWSKK